ncbi:hypothetical protein PG279_10085 [Riemerella anatipestifer]|nr:hypothetical protein [Riemerella anatipestifer]
MKRILILTLFVFTHLAVAQSVKFKIAKNKVKLDKYGRFTLVVKVINNSPKEIIILKPAVNNRQKWRYYNGELDCPEIRMILRDDSTDSSTISYNESDLLIIPSKSKTEISIDGRYNTNSLLQCKANKFKLKLLYDASELLKQVDNNDSQEVDIIKKITPIKIESKLTVINADE